MSKIQKTDHFYLIDGSGYIFRLNFILVMVTHLKLKPIQVIQIYNQMLHGLKKGQEVQIGRINYMILREVQHT